MGGAEAFGACLKKRSVWPEAQLNVGIACWRAGDLVKARSAFESVLASKPGSVDALRGLAALSLDEGDFYNAGLICQRRGEVRDAIVYYREALKVDADFPEALLNLGHALMYIGAKDEARTCWRKAISIKPELADDYFDSESA
jgi:tetratricopeptide (TPR) repeat protein